MERAWKIEGLFGEAKDNHCLRRVRYRGLRNAQIQFYLTALTQNLKRVAAWGVLHIKHSFWSQKIVLVMVQGAVWLGFEEIVRNRGLTHSDFIAVRYSDT